MKKYIFLLGLLFLSSGVIFSATRMQQAPTSSFSPPNSYAYEYTLTSTATSGTPKYSVWVEVPASVKATSMTLSFTGGASAYVETTTDGVYKVEASTATINGLVWNYGTVSTTKQDTAYSISAFRLVQVSTGTATLAVRAQ